MPWPSDEDASTVVLDRSGTLLRAFTTGRGRWRLPMKRGMSIRDIFGC